MILWLLRLFLLIEQVLKRMHDLRLKKTLINGNSDGIVDEKNLTQSHHLLPSNQYEHIVPFLLVDFLVVVVEWEEEEW